MKKLTSKIVTAALAGIMAICTVSTVTASAAGKVVHHYIYQPKDGQKFTYSVNRLYLKYDGGKVGNSNIQLKYRAKTDDFEIVSYQKAYCGDVNLDGQITNKDAILAMEIACLRLCGEDPVNYYSERQVKAAMVTQLIDPYSHDIGAEYNNSIEDAQILHDYVTYAGNYRSIEEYLLKRLKNTKDFSLNTAMEVYSNSCKCNLKMPINVNCKNSNRKSNYTANDGTYHMYHYVN